ncbi:MAG: zinc-ribbon domain-containing protein [Syntrophomonadaceae bacterium]|nr:zinc-ribbon domain-containing protein [Syntrophomonadaceae bacterium]
MKLCNYCGAENRDEALFCSACGQNIDNTADNLRVSANSYSQKEPANTTAIKVFGILIVCLLAVILMFNALTTVSLVNADINQWEYKVVKMFPEEQNDRTGWSSNAYNTIDVDEAILIRLGDAGWELVSSTMEVETAWPNSGNENYVTGIQPNVRPQCLILIFKRPVIE